MLSRAEAPGSFSESPLVRSIPELSTSADKRNLTVPCEEGDYPGSLIRMLEQGSRVVDAASKEAKGSRPSQHVGSVTGLFSIVFVS